MRRLELEAFREEPVVATEAPILPAAPLADGSAAEEIREAGYEAGYKCGWDDAVRASETERRTIGEELARNLRDVGFTYFEARTEVLEAVRELLAQLIREMFGGLLAEAGAAAVLREVMAQIEAGASGRMSVRVSPDDAEIVRSLLSELQVPSVSVREEPTLATGQVQIAGDAGDVRIDSARLIARLRDVIEYPTDIPEALNE